MVVSCFTVNKTKFRPLWSIFWGSLDNWKCDLCVF